MVHLAAFQMKKIFFTTKRTLSIFSILVLVGAMFLTITASQQNQDKRSRAAEITPVTLQAPQPVSLQQATATASNSYSAATSPAMAFDGKLTTSWNSGNFPAQWILINLNQSVNLSSINLTADQNPPGNMVTEIYAGATPSTMQLVKIFSGSTQMDSSLSATFTPSLPNVQYVKVLTSQGVSWVAWKEISFMADTNLSTPRSLLYGILSTGQSLSLGTEGNPGLSLTQPYQNLMLDDTGRIELPDEESSLTYSLTPLVEATNESHASGMGNEISFLTSPNTYQTVVTKHGHGGIGYWGMKKGGVVTTPTGSYSPYNRGINQVKMAMSNAIQAGKTYKVGAVTVTHGENDSWTAQDEYENDLLQWITDYNADVKTITGQTTDFPMITDQVSSHMSSGIALSYPTSALAQLKASEDYPGKIILVGPKYQYDYVCGVGIHLDNKSYRRMGEYYGKVYKQVVIDQKPWKPLSPKTISISGNVITMALNVPVPPIVLDTTQVDLKQNYGFEYWDNSSAPPTITNVSVTGPDSVQITLSSAPVASDARLRYAYTGVINSCSGAHQAGSARGNIRDSDATASLTGNSLANWLVHFDKPITGVTQPPPATPTPTKAPTPTPTKVPLPTATPIPSANIVSGKVYKVSNACSAKVLDVAGWSTVDGGIVHQWTWTGGTNQQWKATAVTGGYFTLTAQHSGKVLDVPGSSTANGVGVVQWTLKGGTNQQWSITKLSNGYFKMLARHSGKALDVSGGSIADGAKVQQWSPNGSCAQQWSFQAL